jgi:hypothetical protein
MAARVPALDREKSPRTTGWTESDASIAHEIVIDPGAGNGNQPGNRE